MNLIWVKYHFLIHIPKKGKHMRKQQLILSILITTFSLSFLYACGSQSQTSAEVSTPSVVVETSTETPIISEEPEPEETPAEPEPVIINASCEQDILDLGLCLFTGTTDQKYASSSCKNQIKEGSPTDRIVIVYACDDPEHGGWGVLGLSIEGESGTRKQIDINAYPDDPGKERLIVYTVQELMDIVEINEPKQFKSFEIGAWNGGRIAGLYYLKDELSKAYEDFANEKAAMNQIKHTYNGSLSNENAIENAKSLYEYLKDSYGNVCITGQMESTWMGSEDYEMNYIYKKTGKYPAIRGLDFMNNDFAGVTRRAKEWWNKGGIVTICWHTGPDFASSYNESKEKNINWEEAFTEGSSTYNSLIAGMDRAVPYLQQLNEAGVPVLWRPFHEFDGMWFWWGKGGGENFVKLWQLMYERYTNVWGLNNLIWVLGYSNSGMDLENWYPGDEYVDIIGGDSYDDGANNDLFIRVSDVAAPDMPITFHECGKIPTESELKADSTNWLYFMTWHTEYLTDTNSDELLKSVYTSDYFITLDELPSFK